MRRCPECGTEFNGEGSFCPNCGKYLPYSESAPYEPTENSPVNNPVNYDNIPNIPPYVPNQGGYVPGGFETSNSSKNDFESCLTPSIGSFILSFFLASIPLVGFIYTLCLALGVTKYKAKKNMARALFIWVFIFLAIESAVLIAVMYFFPEFVNQLNLEYISKIKDLFTFFE